MKLVFALTLTIVFWTAELAKGQTFSAKLELEVTPTKELGKILTLKIIVKNEGNKGVYLDNFIPLFEIEKYNTSTREFENYLDYWFAQVMHDSTRDQVRDLVGYETYGHDSTFDRSFSDEIIRYNESTNDSSDLRHWTNHKVERIEVFDSKGKVEWQQLLNSLPPGSYRCKFHYSNLTEKITIVPVEKFKAMRLPTKLGVYTRWKGEFNSEAVYLTIK